MNLFGVTMWLRAAAMKVLGFNRIILATSNMSEEELRAFFSNEGAAAEGGALSGVGEMVTDFGGGAFTITQQIILYIVGIMILVVGGGMVIHGNNVQKRTSIKEALPWQVLGAVVAFGAIGLLYFLMNMGNSAF